MEVCACRATPPCHCCLPLFICFCANGEAFTPKRWEHRKSCRTNERLRGAEWEMTDKDGFSHLCGKWISCNTSDSSEMCILSSLFSLNKHSVTCHAVMEKTDTCEDCQPRVCKYNCISCAVLKAFHYSIHPHKKQTISLTSLQGLWAVFVIPILFCDALYGPTADTCCHDNNKQQSPFCFAPVKWTRQAV